MVRVERVGRRVDLHCVCQCGGSRIVKEGNFRLRRAASCGCRAKVGIISRQQPMDMIGRTYGAWTVESELPRPPGSTKRRFIARCDCGTTRELAAETLRTGRSTHCGCRRPLDKHSAQHVGRIINDTWRVEAFDKRATRWVLRCLRCSYSIFASAHRLTRANSLDPCTCTLRVRARRGEGPEPAAAAAPRAKPPRRKLRLNDCAECGNPIDPPNAKQPAPSVSHKLLAELLGTVFDLERPEAEARALAFMRAVPGTVIRVPDMAATEQYAAEQAVIARWQRDAGPAAVSHACDFFGIEKKDATVMFRKRVGHGIARERELQGATT